MSTATRDGTTHRVEPPAWSGDLYADAVLADPWDTYRTLRELGPVVWLVQHEVFALPRYAEVRDALTDPATYCSGHGVTLNPLINDTAAGSSVLMTDGAEHDELRKALANRLTPKALQSMAPGIRAAADTLVDRLVARRTFDAISDLAAALPTSIVPDLIGWPHEGRENLLPWAAATFDLMGPPNARADDALPRFAALQEFAGRTVATGDVLPGSIVADLLAAAHRGEVPVERCPVSMIDYLAPSLDTTISAIGRAVALFAEHPDQWDLVRADPKLIRSAFTEVVRLHSPVTQFSRVTTVDTDLAGVPIPAGSRVLVMFASANRDERKYPEPDEFDVRRNPADMVGFGYGTHACAGQGLARLEGYAILAALASRVARFDAGPARPALNNTIHALASLPVTVVPVERS